MARRHEVFVTDEQWEKIKPLLPERRKSAKGGRPPAEDRACLEGILWVLVGEICPSGTRRRARVGGGLSSGKAKTCW